MTFPKPISPYFLWICFVHSVAVGIALITIKSSQLCFFGLDPELYAGAFFRVQGGVFHIAVAVAYFLGATRLKSARLLVLFSGIIKSIAVVFLVTYWLSFDHAWIIIASAFGDAVLAGALFFGYRYDKSIWSDAR